MSAPHVVVHLPGDGDPRSSPSFLYYVRSPICFASLEGEINNSIQWRINNERSTKYQFHDCRPREEVAAVAIEAGSREEPVPEFQVYDFLDMNCDHFAKWCFHGEKESLQTSTNQPRNIPEVLTADAEGRFTTLLTAVGVTGLGETIW
ncbi:uncharacterized protein LOC136037553 [Artemia franciscana]|uniref:uncharacterized protein LOC136037553 n=1 Tax=Artemia franciscana TaxID=6661 RepID=UPI0032DA5411